ncbi:DNA polymerase-3 subunit epsilon [Halospina denitrificans]|uniref:Excinuclease cho n=1 Tax=Halospina denitrificans TaxID=332522 RepID=A0A4R7JYE9_9GAMM|nr:exonuclease domain-containing protein [Halospina denitrificans]TDT43542.1 DNA polymerase-3 subunit epsilon [Halospina denitrificans]
MKLAFIDLETTGGSSTGDRITEIGLRLWEEGEVIEDWQTLVNPQQSIPPFIESLTGISNAMVADAPTFEEVAERFEEKIGDAVFVAHNARFDYGFVKSEFRRIGKAFAAPVLCTVKLSRRLYPEYRRHNMDALIERHGLDPGPRHRAMGDVESMFQFFERTRSEHGVEPVAEAIQALLKRPSIPSHMSPDILDELPDSPGVYRFYGENDVLLYVGKSTDIRQRVASHFSGDHNTSRGVQLSQSMRWVDWTETAGDLGALLLELKQIKGLKPLYNRRSRAAKRLVTIALNPGEEGYLQASLCWGVDPNNLGQYYGLFKSKRDAQKALQGIAQKNELCNQMLGLESTHGPCFQRRLGRCKGACEGLEDVTRYNLRVQIAFHELQLKAWPWEGPIGVVEENGSTGRTDIHVIYNWAHIATVHDEAELSELEPGREALAFDLDSYKLLIKHVLAPGHRLKIIECPGMSRPDVVWPDE